MLCDLCNVAYPIGKKIAYAFGFRILTDFIAAKYLCNELDLHGHLCAWQCSKGRRCKINSTILSFEQKRIKHE